MNKYIFFLLFHIFPLRKMVVWYFCHNNLYYSQWVCNSFTHVILRKIRKNKTVRTLLFSVRYISIENCPGNLWYSYKISLQLRIQIYQNISFIFAYVKNNLQISYISVLIDFKIELIVLLGLITNQCRSVDRKKSIFWNPFKYCS